jgi:hypothetical protein
MSESVRFRINSPKVVQETIDGEVVIVNLDKGDYYSLVQSAADIWSGIERGISTDEIITEIVERYEGSPEEIETAVTEMLQTLEQEEIIVVDDTSRATKSETPCITNGNTEKVRFELPVLQKYTDMEELLALDPIHEVDEMGWPNAKVEA